MRLSWNEVRTRAAAFAEAWKDVAYEKGETQSFYNDFFEVFGKRRREVARYEQHVSKLDNRSGFIDLFWPSVLIVEQKSVGRDLTTAYEQAGEYFDALLERERPCFILVSDFQTFELHDLDEREAIAFPLTDLPAHVEAFGFILGVQRRTFRDQDPANIEAAELVGRLHDALADAGHRGHDLERFLVRVVFCMFADDTGGQFRFRPSGNAPSCPDECLHATSVSRIDPARRIPARLYRSRCQHRIISLPRRPQECAGSRVRCDRYASGRHSHSLPRGRKGEGRLGATGTGPPLPVDAGLSGR